MLKVYRANFMTILSTNDRKPWQFKKMLVLPLFLPLRCTKKPRMSQEHIKRHGNAAGLVFQDLSSVLLVPPLVQGLRVPTVSSQYANPNTFYWPPSTHR